MEHLAEKQVTIYVPFKVDRKLPSLIILMSWCFISVTVVIII